MVNIMLYSIAHDDYFYQYSSPIMPLLGAIIEPENSTYFCVTKQVLMRGLANNDTIYLLSGNFIGRGVNQADFENMKYRLSSTKVDIELNSYGDVLFPATIDEY